MDKNIKSDPTTIKETKMKEKQNLSGVIQEVVDEVIIAKATLGIETIKIFRVVMMHTDKNPISTTIVTMEKIPMDAETLEASVAEVQEVVLDKTKIGKARDQSSTNKMTTYRVTKKKYISHKSNTTLWSKSKIM